MVILKESRPVARKEHTCDLCYGTISVGERYYKQTNVCDHYMSDWACHSECLDIANKLDMYDGYSDSGLEGDSFIENLNDYVSEYHYDKETCDIAEDWKLSPHELVKKILEELERKSHE